MEEAQTIDNLIAKAYDAKEGRCSNEEMLEAVREYLCRVSDVQEGLPDYGYIFVVYDPKRGLCKIGSSKNPNRDIQALLTMAEITKPDQFISFPVFNHALTLREVHFSLEGCRVRGNWYACDIQSIVDAIDAYAIPADKAHMQMVDILTAAAEREGLLQPPAALAYMGKYREKQERLPP